MTHNLIFGILTVRLVPEGVMHVTGLVHGIPQHLQLLEHSLVRDVASCGLIDDYLRPKERPLQAVLHIQCLWLGAFLMKKFMDLEASSPRTAERIVSIRELSPHEDNPAGVTKKYKSNFGEIACMRWLWYKSLWRSRMCIKNR